MTTSCLIRGLHLGGEPNPPCHNSQATRRSAEQPGTITKNQTRPSATQNRPPEACPRPPPAATRTHRTYPVVQELGAAPMQAGELTAKTNPQPSLKPPGWDLKGWGEGCSPLGCPGLRPEPSHHMLAGVHTQVGC